jgi:hypothetical protein
MRAAPAPRSAATQAPARWEQRNQTISSNVNRGAQQCRLLDTFGCVDVSSNNGAQLGGSGAVRKWGCLLLMSQAMGLNAFAMGI